MAFFNRKLYRQKPQQWGPASQVQSSIFANADREGYDPGSIALAMPMWEGAGLPNDTIKRYTLSAGHSSLGFSSTSPGWVYFPSSSGGGYLNKGLQLVGTNTGILDFTNDFTFIAKVKLTRAWDPNDYRAILAKRFGTSVYQYHWRVTNNGGLSLLTSGGSVACTQSINLDTEYTLSVTRTSADTKFYIDGKFINSVASKSLVHKDSDVTVGGTMFSGTYNGLGGLIEFVDAFSSALTDSQIAHLSDNPYFLLHRQPSVFYSVPSGAITLRQFGFQFYQDNADHTPIGTENDASVSLAPGSKFRIRMGIVKE